MACVSASARRANNLVNHPNERLQYAGAVVSPPGEDRLKRRTDRPQTAMSDPGPVPPRERGRHQGHPDASLDERQNGLGMILFVPDLQGDPSLAITLTDYSREARGPSLRK